MRAARLILFGIILLGVPTAAVAQEPTRAPGSRVGRDRALQRPIPVDSTGLPIDTLGLPADTTPGIDIEARRQALETEGFPARDDIFRQLKDLLSNRVDRTITTDD